MRDKLINSRENKLTLLDIDIAFVNQQMPIRERLFSICLGMCMTDKAKEFHYSPTSDLEYKLSLLMEDGSKVKLLPLPRFMFKEFLKIFKEQKIMNYDPYSDEKQCSLINVKYIDKIYQLELCVQQSKYGREIVVKRLAKKTG